VYERLAQIDPSLATFLPGAARAAQRAAQPRPSAPYLDEEEEQSLVGSLRDKGVSFIGSVGNFLDLPGSMVRDVASSAMQGKFVNPFDQLLSPLSSDNRTTGRDLARQAGMASSQDTWGNAIGGFGLEVALDPLTYVTGGASALTKLGKGASKVGLLDDLGKVARKKGLGDGPVQAGVIGPRQARTTTSLQDFITYGDEATRAKAEKLLQGVSPEDAAKPIGGLYNIGVPFMDPIATLGTGAMAQKYAKGMDTAMRTLRYGRPIAGMEAPVNAFLNLFDAPAGGAKTAFGAEQARERFRARQTLPTAVKAKVAERGMFLDNLVKNPQSHLARGLDDYLKGSLSPEEFATLADNKVLKHRAISDAIRDGVEGVKPPEELPDAINWIVKSIREEVEALPDEMRLAGGRVKELVDDEIDYAARYAVEPSIRKTKPKDASQVPKDPSMSNERLDFLKNIAGGTAKFAKEVAADPKVREIVADGKYLRPKIQDAVNPEDFDVFLGPEGLAKYIEDKHGEWLSDKYITWTDNGVRKEREGRYKKIGQMLYAMDAEQLKAGVFGNHVLLDQQARMVSHMDAVNGLNKLTDALSEPGVLKSVDQWLQEGVRVKAADDTTVPLLGLLKKMDLDFYKTHNKQMPTGEVQPIQGGIGPVLAEKLGVDIKDLKKMRVDKRMADDLAQLNKAITGPEAVGDILQMVDSFTNFSKGMWTSIWPAFHVRNQVSGWLQNAMLGMWDPQSASAAVRMQQGKPVEMAMEIPAVREAWEKRIREVGGPLQPPNRTRVVKEIEEVFGPQGVEYVPVLDARAEAWAMVNNKTPDAWYSKLKVERGDAPTAADMQQGPLRQGAIDVGGVKRPTVDSTGAPIHTTEEGVKNFWESFKDSKVVDADGRPMVVYHGTKGPEFGSFDGGSRGTIHFTTNSKTASEYAWSDSGEGGRILPVYLSIKNPANSDDLATASNAVRMKNGGEYPSESDLMDELKSMGHDGWRSGDEYVAFDKTQIKSAIGNRGTFDTANPNILYQSTPNTGFYSKLSEATDQKVGGKVAWEQYEKTMKGAGVKSEEIDDLGLKEFFESGPKTKQEIQSYIKENTPQVSVTQKGQSTGDARYAGYRVPGGEDGTYREILLTIPEQASPRVLNAAKNELLADGVTPDMGAWNRVVAGVNEANVYQSEHWTQNPNVVAHLRMDDVINPDGTKTLRVTEIQSDWHQDGRKLGYKPSEAELDAAAERAKEIQFKTPSSPEEAASLREESVRLGRLLSQGTRDQMVPDGPFKKSWSRLAFKQALKVAAEEGYDEIALVVGRDAAQAVGGPIKEMDEAYRIMLQDAKEYTKKYKSYVGETEVTKTAQYGSSLNNVQWSTFDQYGLSEATLNGRAVGTVEKEIDEVTGATVYRATHTGEELGVFASQEEAKRALSESNFGGFIDAGYKPYDGGMHVFKVTDDMKKDILGKGQPLYQGADAPRGQVAFEQSKAVITAFQSADISTLVHETAHVFRRDLPEDLLNKAAKVFNVEDPKAWPVEAEEAFASGFERYMRDGQSPTPELASVFDKFKDWLTAIYRTIMGTPLQSQVSPELRDVFDQMLGKGIDPAVNVKAADWSTIAKRRPDITPDSKLTPEIATEILAEMLYGSSAIGSHDANRLADVAGGVEATSGTLPNMLAGVPRPGAPSIDMGRVARKATFQEPGSSKNPVASRGVGGRTETTFGLAAAGEEIGNFIEGNNRIQPMINLLKKGYSLDEAKAKVDAAQVAYSGKNYTKFETQVMARLLPFYKFSRSQLPFHAKQILERPGGPNAQMLRGMNNAQDQGELAPEYVRQTASIPVEGDSVLSKIFGAPPEGVDRYVAGLGMMNEDLFSLAPDSGSLMREFLGRTNPLIKGPLEYATNQSFFQSGPEGGRSLDDMDPLMGRLISNVMGKEDAVKLPKMLEQAVSNSPVARILSTARTLTDPRKQSDYGGFMPERTPGPATLFNLLSGVRVTDVSPGSRDAIVRDLLNREMKDTGASVFERVSFTKADLAKMSPEERENAIKLQALANVLAKRAKERKREREKAEANK
jgi:hypothetical protein